MFKPILANLEATVIGLRIILMKFAFYHSHLIEINSTPMSHKLGIILKKQAESHHNFLHS